MFVLFQVTKMFLIILILADFNNPDSMRKWFFSDPIGRFVFFMF